MSRKLDEAIVRALGRDVGKTHILKEVKYFPGLAHTGKFGSDAPHYSTNGSAMLELEGEMRSRGWCIEISSCNNVSINPKSNGEPTFMVNITSEFNHTEHVSVAGTMPEALARAARKALTGEGCKEG